MKSSNLSISVLICTRNRAAQLRACLQSLVCQTTKPSEVIIINNASSDDTMSIIKHFRTLLHIRILYEKNIGLPFARNTSIQHARGDILLFLDDDCIAQKEWITTVKKYFRSHRKIVGLIGQTKPYDAHNIPGLVEYIYYYRWMLYNFEDPNAYQPIVTGAFIDFKNASFRRDYIEKFRFSTTIPFGDVGDEDIEIGARLLPANRNIWYAPDMTVAHVYSSSIKRLFIRNFRNGYANYCTEQSGIHIKNMSKRVSTVIYFFSILPTLAEYQHLSLINRFLLILLLLIYPIASKVGRCYAAFHMRLSQKPIIPKRT